MSEDTSTKDKVLQLLKDCPPLSATDIMHQLDMNYSRVAMCMKRLHDNGIIKKADPPLLPAPEEPEPCPMCGNVAPLQVVPAPPRVYYELVNTDE